MEVCGHSDLQSDAPWALSHSSPSIILSVACMWETQQRKCLSTCLLEEVCLGGELEMPGEGGSKHSHGGVFIFLPSMHEAVFIEMLPLFSLTSHMLLVWCV